MGLDEYTLCVARDSLPKEWLGKHVSLSVSNQGLEFAFSKTEYLFRCRREIEEDSTYKQLIPYVLVFNAKGELLTYKRQGTETRLNQMWSIGVGGHINQGDWSPNMSLIQCIECGMQRECFEELGIVCNDFKLHGIINEEITKVGHTHFGIMFSIELKNFLTPHTQEFNEVQFINISYIQKLKLELWSELAISLYLKK